MSTLSVTNISSANGTTDLTVRSGNALAGAIVFSANGNGFVLQGNSSTNNMVVNSSAVSFNTSVSFSSINASSFTVGSTFIANSISLNSNGFIANSTSLNSNGFVVNSTSLSANGIVANSTGVYDSSDNLRSVPVISKTAAYVLASSDNGKTVSTNANITVNGALLTANQIFTVFNNSSANISIIAGTGATVYIAGTANTGNTTLAQRGVATVLCLAANTFVISGAGLS